MRPLLLWCIIWPFSLFGQDLFFNKVGNFTFTNPVDIVNTGIQEDDRLFIVQKGGTIKIIENISTGSPSLVSGNFLSRSVDPSGEGGLLSLVFDPDYKNNGYFYVYYTHSTSGQFTSFISRYAVNNWQDNSAISNSETLILSIPQVQTNHNGGDLAFSPDGYLFISLGDGGGAGDPADHGQDSTSLLGSILRIDVNTLPYTIPQGNPYINDPSIPDEIWSHGWRNPWRFFMDNVSGNLIVGDVGQGQREEINIQSTSVGGHNFGWNCFEGTTGYDLADCLNENQYEGPIYEYNHSIGRSVTGGVVYRGNRIPSLYGKYIFTDYINSEVFWLLSIDGNQLVSADTILFSESNALTRVASMGIDNQGEMYAAEYRSGQLYRISSIVLPLVLEAFWGESYDTYNVLKWTTFSEDNFDYFSVERKQNEKDFAEIGTVKGKANITGYNEYNFEDKRINTDALYRLKMVDLDGSFTYSKVISIVKNNRTQIEVYPNPAAEILFISNPGSLTIKYYIVNETGQIIMQKTSNAAEKIIINIQAFPEGIYFINIEDSENKKFTGQFIVTH